MSHHALNRGNARRRVSDADYAAFWGLIGEACGRVPVRVLAAYLMPNHFHLVLRPRGLAAGC